MTFTVSTKLGHLGNAGQEPPVRFVPAVVEAVPGLPPRPASQPRRARRHGPVMGIEVEIDGIVVRIGSGASPQAIAAVIRDEWRRHCLVYEVPEVAGENGRTKSLDRLRRSIADRCD